LRVRVPSATRLRPAVAGLRRGRPSFANPKFQNPISKSAGLVLGFEISAVRQCGTATAKDSAHELSHRSLWPIRTSRRHSRLLETHPHDEELRECDNLEKLLAGCEIIAVLDGRDLLAA
jgi:hypothetical protein